MLFHLSNTACGEPPMCMSCSALFALKRAIEAARRNVDIFKDDFFPLGKFEIFQNNFFPFFVNLRY